jgi:putative endonuclease
MFYYVYVLESTRTNEYYIGLTHDLRRRFLEHNRKLNRSTKAYAPWELIHYEAYKNQEDAKRRERYLKTNQGARLLKRMLKEYRYQKRFK